MNRVLICDLKNHVGEDVKLSGFVDTVRDQKSIQFIVLRDHTGFVQMVNWKETSADSISQDIKKMSLESAISVDGNVVLNEKVKPGGVEVQIKNLTIESLSESPLPIDEATELDKRLDWKYLDLRKPENLLTFKAQTALESGMRDYWLSNGFLEIHTPKLMATASESGSELFKLPYFEMSATLAQSPQFYKQMAMAAGFDRIFEIGPVFRANPSFTSRHDTEFTSVDMEVSWIQGHDDLMIIEEDFLCHALKNVSDVCGDGISRIHGLKIVVPKRPFPRVTLAEARDIAKMQGCNISDNDDLSPEGERALSRYIKDTYDHEFVFITDYDASIRPFYHMRNATNNRLTRSFDLVWKGVEITTGAQREHRIDVLVEQIKEKGLSVDELSNYIDFFRYGCPPHGGMGVGLTRLLMLMLGYKNVREVTFLFRGPKRLTP